MMDNFRENMKMQAKEWFNHGVGKTRNDNEIACYIEGAETATFQVLEAIGKNSIATYHSNMLSAELEDYIYEVLLSARFPEDKE